MATHDNTMEEEIEVIEIKVLPNQTVEDVINNLGINKKHDPEKRFTATYNGVVLNSWQFKDGHDAFEYYEKELEMRKIHEADKQETLEMANRILNPSDEEKERIQRLYAELTDPNGKFISAKRAYENGEKPQVEIDGKTVILDSPAAFSKYQKHMYKAYDEAVLSTGGGHNAVALRARSEHFCDLYDGMIPAMIAAEQIKLMQDTIQKTSRETHQLFRDPAFLDMVSRSQFTLLGTEILKASNGQESVFDKNILAGIRNKSELTSIGNMFISMMGDAQGEMRSSGGGSELAAASNIIARTFRIAFIDQATDALKVTSGQFEQQYTHNVTSRDEMISSFTGSSDSNARAVLSGVDIAALKRMGVPEGPQIDAMRQRMQDNLDALKNINDIQRNSLQNKLDKLFANTVEALRLDTEKNAIVYRVKELEGKDHTARRALAEDKENGGKLT